MKKVLFIFTLIYLGIISCSTNSFNPDKDGIYAVINTNKGDIIVELFYDKTPMTVANFVALAEGNMDKVSQEFKGKKYYDGVVFHRVIKDFMIQAGDPTGTGAGGPGYSFSDEFVQDLKHDTAGILSMANAGPNTNGSQFFITHKETPWLDGKHTVFGKIINEKQMEIVDTIQQGDTIKSVHIHRKGKEAKEFNAVEVFDKISKQKEEESKKALEEFKKTMDEYKSKAITTKSGLKIYIKEKGKGVTPKKNQIVLANYVGMLETGKIFGTNNEEIAKINGNYDPRISYQPKEFPIGAGKVIKGWDEGFLELNVGTKAILFIPSELGYGEREIPGIIPANSNLIFDVELVDIKK